ncbi:acetyl-coA [Nesidiocoris tenuis]|uniref:Acetyl-coA n=1 Tax=Nesidiocoris tenuis TaxID=355587 RepID=A0ABN7A7G5_9HEMI|nr:acetyl-coA [Nesidiocoris tenuis]
MALPGWSIFPMNRQLGSCMYCVHSRMFGGTAVQHRGVMEKEVGDKGPVNFIVGDDGAENDVDASAAEFREERQDIFPPSTDLLSPQSSYNNMFGVAERRKRLR